MLHSFFASSQDSTQVSNRVKGIILGLSSIIILVASQFFHITLSANDVVSLASEAGTIVGAIWAIYGAGLAIVTKFAKK